MPFLNLVHYLMFVVYLANKISDFKSCNFFQPKFPKNFFNLFRTSAGARINLSFPYDMNLSLLKVKGIIIELNLHFSV